MAQAEIGALRVRLAMDAGEFTRGLVGAESRTKKFGTAMHRLGESVRKVAAAMAAAFAAVGAAVGRAVSGMIGDIDKLSKTSDKIGIPIDDLQRLRHAAELSGVAVNTLDMAMQRFSRRVGEAVQGGGELKGILDQYNIAITDAAGRTRSQTDILNDLANVIANAGSEQEQLRIAFKAFDSEGAALVNMLRGGSVALRGMMREADQLGIVIDGKTRRAAVAFTDTMTRLGKVKDAFVLKITAHLLPALQSLSDIFLSTARSSEAAERAAHDLSVIFKVVATAAIVVATAVGELAGRFGRLVEAMKQIVSGDFAGFWQNLKDSFSDTAERFQFMTDAIKRLWGEASEAAEAGANRINAAGQSILPPPGGGGEKDKKAEAERQRLAEQLEQFKFRLLTEEEQEQASFIKRLEQLRAYYDAHLISTMEHQDLITATAEAHEQKLAEIARRAADERVRTSEMEASRKAAAARREQVAQSQAMNQTVGAVTAGLSAIFGQNKKAGIANAIISTAVGIMNAFRDVPWPASIAAAAQVAATGAAQIAAISASSIGGGGSAPAVSGGASAAQAQAQSAPAQTLVIEGLDPGQMFSGSAVRDLAEKLIEYQKDGGKVVFA